MSKLRKSARGESCTFRFPGVCSFDTEQTVLCHAPQKLKGRSLKAPDRWAAYGCYPCHLLADKPSDDYWKVHDFYRYWMEAIEETQDRMEARGLLHAA